MSGDVGEYLTYSYSRTAGPQDIGIRLGQAGDRYGEDTSNQTIYADLTRLVDDVRISQSNGVPRVCIDSLSSFLESYSETGIIDLASSVLTSFEVPVTYTFRIYAFRGVLQAIDALDFIML
jgi:hypothetical protein